MIDSELEQAALKLEASGRYRVLRRVEAWRGASSPAGVKTRLGLFVDVETTGLDSAKDEIIELAMVPFTYGIDGQIYEVRPAFQQFREPRTPISEEITRLTGITNEMVAGHSIKVDEVAAFVADVDLVLAHNAGFDRRFVERLSPAFVTKPWACSMSQVDWASEGYEGRKLGYLTMEAGYFYERHRATTDCLAAISLLAMSLPKSRAFAMAQLLERARRPDWRIWAENSPFDFKDILKARGYRWNGDGNASPRAWYIDVGDEEKDAELAFLRNEIYQREIDPLTKKITAYERFSNRC